MQIVILIFVYAYGILTLVKRMITLGMLIFSTLFSWLGQEIDKGNWLGGWSILLGIVGAFVGVWVGYKAYNLYF